MVDKVLYFAYGHNTNVAEMMYRIPSARLLGRGTVHGYKLVMEHFTDIRPDTKGIVQGVLWAIPTTDIPRLDFLEDLRDHYHHIQLTVNYGGKSYHAFGYQMFKNYHNMHLPTRKYINFIAKGYRENKIPMTQLINAVKERLDREKKLHAEPESNKKDIEKQ